MRKLCSKVKGGLRLLGKTSQETRTINIEVFAAFSDKGVGAPSNAGGVTGLRAGFEHPGSAANESVEGSGWKM